MAESSLTVAAYAFESLTPLGFVVRCSASYWEFIVAQKHPVLRSHEQEIALVLRDPNEIRESRKDPTVPLFY